GIKVADSLPANLVLNRLTASRGSYDPGQKIWQIDRIAAQQSITLSHVAKAINAGTGTNTAEIITVDQPDPDSIPANHLAREDDQEIISILVSSTIIPALQTDEPTVRPPSTEELASTP